MFSAVLLSKQSKGSELLAALQVNSSHHNTGKIVTLKQRKIANFEQYIKQQSEEIFVKIEFRLCPTFWSTVKNDLNALLIKSRRQHCSGGEPFGNTESNLTSWTEIRSRDECILARQ